MGQGEFGPVMKAVARDLVPGEAETEVAVKLLVTEDVEDTGFRADLAMVDYASHMKLRYRSIAAILGICSDKEPYYVMYEYLDKVREGKGEGEEGCVGGGREAETRGKYLDKVREGRDGVGGGRGQREREGYLPPSHTIPSPL